MMWERPTLNDCYPGWDTGSGVFKAFGTLSVPWSEQISNDILDKEYHGNISGEKYVSNLVNRYYEQGGGALASVRREQLANMIHALYANTWAKQWATYQFEYNPIENYSMTEKMENDQTTTTYGKTSTLTNNLTHTKTGDETSTPDITETQTPNLTTDTETSVYGFNSSSASPSGNESQKSTGTNTVSRTGTDIHDYNVTDADTGTQTNADTGTDTNTRNYTLTRSGNIGVTTSQQMIESERNLWMWNFFYDVVFPDLDKVLTLPIY